MITSMIITKAADSDGMLTMMTIHYYDDDDCVHF
jgi:hypothetical protein